MLAVLATKPDRQGPIVSLRLAGPRDEDGLRGCAKAQGQCELLSDAGRQATPGSCTQCKHPKKLDCKLRPPLEPERVDCAVAAAFALHILHLVFADLREAYFEDIRSPADPGLWTHA